MKDWKKQRCRKIDIQNYQHGNL